eukprot:TRINITY_DN12760_c0_g1_i2.p1 TRINITY_DN12760_c0_g1~~TRINITY_DN12760_c0_g1_i2.p1  ORF type:complete len:141 (+),score=39.75 TRINITY_DN12760_c0_g1_i2:197-619(+)
MVLRAVTGSLHQVALDPESNGVVNRYPSQSPHYLEPSMRQISTMDRLRQQHAAQEEMMRSRRAREEKAHQASKERREAAWRREEEAAALREAERVAEVHAQNQWIIRWEKEGEQVKKEQAKKQITRDLLMDTVRAAPARV